MKNENRLLFQTPDKNKKHQNRIIILNPITDINKSPYPENNDLQETSNRAVVLRNSRLKKKLHRTKSSAWMVVCLALLEIVICICLMLKKVRHDGSSLNC